MGEIKVLPREENECGDKAIETPEKKFEKKSTIEVHCHFPHVRWFVVKC